MRGERLERPELPSGGQIDLPLGGRAAGRHTRVGGTRVDPMRKVGNHLVRQLTGGWHLQTIELERLDEQALSRFAANYRWSALAPAQHTVARVEEQFSLELLVLPGLLRMAGIATLDQHGPNLLFKEFDVF